MASTAYRKTQGRKWLAELGRAVLAGAGKTRIWVYRLDAVEDEGQLFILFSDHSSGVDTYGTGRFLYADHPDKQGLTVLDFNRAINPPCAFTPFATCPLPPPQNALPLVVAAGEKSYGGH